MSQGPGAAGHATPAVARTTGISVHGVFTARTSDIGRMLAPRRGACPRRLYPPRPRRTVGCALVVPLAQR